jgi:spore coat polysaccharide biosynthesis protein SpsF
MRSAVIVQARVGSTRLPGKVLMDLAGRTVLRHVLERCLAVEGVDVVCCAVPKGEADDSVAEEASSCQVMVVRGPEHDVLGRYLQAAVECRADVIVRITSDCPLLDPRLVTMVLTLVTEKGADYACNTLPPRFPHGLDCEAFTFYWLQRAAQEARLASEREHVTPYLRTHPQVRKECLDGPGGQSVLHRWTLDDESDLRFLRALIPRLPSGAAGYDYRIPLAIVESEPELAAINAGHDRYAWLKDTPTQNESRSSGGIDPPKT